MRDSQKPIAKVGGAEVFPPIKKERKFPTLRPFPQAPMTIDIPAVKETPREALILQGKIHTLYPESSDSEISVKDRRIFLGAKRIGIVSNSKESPGKARIWVDELLKSGAIPQQHFEEEFPKNPEKLSSMLPFSALCGMVSADVASLARLLESCRYAALVCDGYAVRLEFHHSKRAEAIESFVLKARA